MKKVVLSVVGLSLLALAGCGMTTPSAQGPQTIKIGVIAPLSEWAATYGQDAVNAYKEVIAKNNDDKYTFELVVEDGKCAGKDAVSAAQKLINVDKVQVIVWGICSAETIGAGKIADQNHIAMISPVSSSPEISGLSPYVFRYWNDVDASKVLVDELANLSIKSISLVYANTDYAVAYAQAIKNTYPGVVVQEIKYDEDEKDFSIIAKTLASKKDVTEAIVPVVVGDVGAVQLLRAMDAEGLLDYYRGKIIGSETLGMNAVGEAMKDRIDGALSITLPEAKVLGSKAQDFIDAFSAKYTINSSDVFVVLEADAMQLAIDALKKSGNNGDAVKEYISGFGPKHTISGLLGTYYFNSKNDGQGLHFAIKKYENGKLVNLQ